MSAYRFYLGSMLLPVTPDKLQIKIKDNNKTYKLINEGEINVLKTPGLTDISFEALLPNVKYPFAQYKSGFSSASSFLEQIKALKASQAPFQFIVTRSLPNGKSLFGTNIQVALESYTIKEDAKNTGMDVTVSIELKQYRAYGTKTCAIVLGASVSPSGEPADMIGAPDTSSATNYSVKKGDSLWNIAKKVYGDGSKYTKILDANKDKISNANLIYPGQDLTIPSA